MQNTLDGSVESALKAAQTLKTIPAILRGIEGAGFNGSVTIDNQEDMMNYVTQVANLDSASQKAANGIISLDASLKSQFNTIQSNLQTGASLNAQLFERTLAVSKIDPLLQKQIITETGLVDAQQRYVVVETNVVKQNLLNSASFKTLSTNEQAAVLAAVDDTVAKQAQTAATVQLTVAQKALNIAMGIGKQMLIGLAIGAVTYGIQKLVEVVKEANPSVEELASRAQEANDAYKSTQGTLDEYKKKLEDINEKKKLVREGKITDPAEIAEIENQSSYIEAQIKLYQNLLEEKAKVANANAWEAANAKTHFVASDYSIEDDPNGVGYVDGKSYNNYDYLDERISKYNELSSSLSNLSQQYDKGEISQEEFETQSQELKDTMEDVKTQIDNTYESISNNFNSAIDDATPKYNALKEKTDAATQSYLAFTDAVDGAKQAQEELNDASDSDAWKTDTPAELAEFMSDLSDSSSDLYDKTKALTSAYNDMYQNQKLSSDSIQALISAYPELINQLETENGVTKINKELLSDKFETLKASMVTTIESEIQATQTAIAQAQVRISIYQNEIKALTTLYSSIGMVVNAANAGSAGAFHLIDNMSEEEYAAYEKYQAAQQGIEDMGKTIEEANAQLADQKKALDVLNNLTLPNYSGATKGASSANKGAAQAAKAHKKELEAQKTAAENAKKELENYSKVLKAQGDAIIKVLDKRKDALEKEKDARDKAFDKAKDQLEEQQKLQDKVYDKQKEALEEKKKALQDANDEEDRAIKLSQLQDELAKAQSQRTKRVYQHDTGFEWQTDSSAVSDAQNNLDDQQRTWKREDAIDAVEKEIDAIEKLKDAYDEEVDAAVDAIEKQKDAYDDAIDAQIDKIEEMKDKYQEVLDLVGMSWDEYQAQLDATALAQGMTLDGMGEYLGGFKDNVLQNMQQLTAAEAEVKRITDELSGLDTSSSSGGSSGGGGGGLGAVATSATSGGYAGLSANLKNVADKMQENIGKLNVLKAQEADLKDQIDNGNLSANERTDAFRKLGDVQQQITDKEADLNEMSANYIETLGAETDATDEYRQSAVNYLQILTEEYGADYEKIFEKLEDYIDRLQDTDSMSAEEYESMSASVETFSTSVSDTLGGIGTEFDTLVEKVQTAAQKIEETCKSAVENLSKLKIEASKTKGEGSNAIGSRGIRKSGYYHVDESGPEIVVHDGKVGSGRYTYLERGDAVLPASFSKNLWDMGANPGEWFERQYSKFNRMDNSKAVYAGGTTVYSPSFTGDIVITNPVANSDDLARSLKQNLPASFMQAVGVRM